MQIKNKKTGEQIPITEADKYRDNEKMIIHTFYRILSPDGFDIEFNKTYTAREIEPAVNAFVARFKAQGYYSTSNREHIAIEDIAKCCEVLEA